MIDGVELEITEVYSHESHIDRYESFYKDLEEMEAESQRKKASKQTRANVVFQKLNSLLDHRAVFRAIFFALKKIKQRERALCSCRIITLEDAQQKSRQIKELLKDVGIRIKLDEFLFNFSFPKRLLKTNVGLRALIQFNLAKMPSLISLFFSGIATFVLMISVFNVIHPLLQLVLFFCVERIITFLNSDMFFCSKHDNLNRANREIIFKRSGKLIKLREVYKEKVFTAEFATDLLEKIEDCVIS